MSALTERLVLISLLFALVFAGYALVRWAGDLKRIGHALSAFVFNIALPVMLFHLMSNQAGFPPVDMRLLLAFFGGCLLVFLLGRLVAARGFGLDGVSGSVFALGGVFSNNAMLGLPVARIMLGDAAIPAVALVMVFNALVLWTLVTVSVEWARHGSFSWIGFARTGGRVLANPIVIGVLLGCGWGMTGWQLPLTLDRGLELVGDSTGPLALVALGMSLAEFGVVASWRVSLAISGIKLLLQPLVVWLLALALGLPDIETQAVVLLASMAVGANVYLMARQFRALEGPVASSLVLSTALASVTTPLMLALTH
ncbi:AEC family transporter [Uliginosibacterium sp. H1]|uniref:AEC family transporter n=1 Tax=Uliginosibacterium sp. H1 TaxID=3114757 RepID=UPI002E19A00A|nr:AEC family transporter [Uliginosibacterium sp. H1]